MTVAITMLVIGGGLLAFVALSLGLKANASNPGNQSAKVTYTPPAPFVGTNRRNG